MSRICLAIFAVTICVAGNALAEEPLSAAPFEFESSSVSANEAQRESQQPIPLRRADSNTELDEQQSSNGPSFGTVLIALSFVVLLAFGVAKLFGKHAPHLPGREVSPVDVLHRQAIDPKNSICIVRVGSRLLVLGSSAAGLTTLSELAEPAEVEALTIELRAANEGSSGTLGAMTRWFDRRRGQATETTPPSSTSSDVVAGLTVREIEEGRRV